MAEITKNAKQAPVLLACAALLVLAAGCGPAAATPGAPSAVTATLGACADPLSVVHAFYDANDAGQWSTSLALLTDDVTLASWAEGMNGHHMTERHLSGKDQIRSALSNPGLRRGAGQPGGPVFHETEFSVSGDMVVFMLRPDRVRPNGRVYNPYRLELVFVGCQIKSLTVIEIVSSALTWNGYLLRGYVAAVSSRFHHGRTGDFVCGPRDQEDGGGFCKR